MLQRWRGERNTVPDLTGPRFEYQTSRYSSGAGTWGGGGQGAAAPSALLPGGARGAVLPFAFQYDSNEANASLLFYFTISVR